MSRKCGNSQRQSDTAPYYKRLLEWYAVDPDFALAFLKNPQECLRDKRLPLDAGTALSAIRIQYGMADAKERETGNPYVTEYRNWIQQVHEKITAKTGKEQFQSQSLYRWNQVVKNRLYMENSRLRRHSNIFYYPIAFELGEGCTVQCPFCGVSADEWKGNFMYTSENGRMWCRILEISQKLLGKVVGTAPCYYGTEPFDNPDYEKFLEDFYRLTGEYPQTTTAVAERDPGRVRKLFTMLGDEYLAQAAVRLSIRTKQQFYSIMKEYTPEELRYVELLPNNIESMYSYSLSGRARQHVKDFPKEKMNERYSISCIAGVKVNMARKTITMMEPEIPEERFPNGVRIYETCSFGDEKDYEEKLKTLLERYVHPDLPQDKKISMNQYVSLIQEGTYLSFQGDHVTYRMGGNNLFIESIRLIQTGAYTFEALSKELKIGDFISEGLKAKLNMLYQKGYLRCGV